MYYWSRKEEMRLLSIIEEWETLTEWARTDEEIMQAILKHKVELLRYSLYDLAIILSCAFDSIVVFTDGWKKIPFDVTNGKEKVYDISPKGNWEVLIEI